MDEWDVHLLGPKTSHHIFLCSKSYYHSLSIYLVTGIQLVCIISCHKINTYIEVRIQRNLEAFVNLRVQELLNYVYMTETIKLCLHDRNNQKHNSLLL